MGWRFVVAMLFSVVIAIFAIANAGSVRVNFIFAVYEVSQAIVILVSAIAGALIVMFMSLIKQVQLKMKISSQDKAMQDLQKEKEKLQSRFAEAEKAYEDLLAQKIELEEADCPVAVQEGEEKNHVI